jgi:hypothetical protein
MTSSKNENFMISLNNNCKSWLSHETKKTCFISEYLKISAHMNFMMKHVFVIIQLILHSSLLMTFLQSFITHSIWTIALIFSTISIVAFKWNFLSFEVIVDETWQQRLMTRSFRMLIVSSVKKPRYLQAFNFWLILSLIVSYVSFNSLSLTSLWCENLYLELKAWWWAMTYEFSKWLKDKFVI